MRTAPRAVGRSTTSPRQSAPPSRAADHSGGAQTDGAETSKGRPHPFLTSLQAHRASGDSHQDGATASKGRVWPLLLPSPLDGGPLSSKLGAGRGLK